MEIYERLLQEAEIVFRNLQAQGIEFEVTGKNTLQTAGVLTDASRQKIKVWKAQIIHILSPKCERCGCVLQFLKNPGDKKLWMCPMGCESKEKQD